MASRPIVIEKDDPAYAGQAAYTPAMLRSYDTLVVGLSNRAVWRCPSEEMVAAYEANVGPHHVDVGPGTGYYLDAANLPQLDQLALVDANHAVLEHAAARLAHHAPRLVQANVFEPIDDVGGADSVACNFLLHCLPGDMDDKAEVIANVARLLSPGGVLFGATILGDSARHHALGRVVMRAYNAKGVFGNADDTLDGLRHAIAGSCTDVTIDVRGAVALFRARRP